MKKIMFLGGAESQTVAITTAKKMGYQTVLCDYLPNNPGRKLADQWYPASTTDYTAVLEIAKKEKIDGILTYGSDVAASTVAYVAERLGLPGSPFESVFTLTHKDRFRRFLEENGFCVPWSISFSENERRDAVDYLKGKCYPVIVKPVDSQGAKGISKVCEENELPAAIDYALSKSICKRFIVEEFIHRKGMQIGGDGFTVDGKIVFAPFSNSYFSNEPGLEMIPLAECWPPVSSSDLLQRAQDEIQRALRLLGMRTQAYNFEAMEDQTGNLHLIEIGPRNGGSAVPVMTEKMTGCSMVRATVQAAAGDPIDEFGSYQINGFWASRSICSKKPGVLQSMTFDGSFERYHLRHLEQYVPLGGSVAGMNSLSSSIAFVGAQFDTREEMMDFVRFPEKYVKAEIE